VYIAKKDLAKTHVLVAVFWNSAPHTLRADYGFGAYYARSKNPSFFIFPTNVS
jgi:hypothetical protein